MPLEPWNFLEPLEPLFFIIARMTRSRLLSLLAIVVLGSVAITATRADQGPSSPRPPGMNYKSPAFTFNKIADGVYHAVATGSLVVKLLCRPDHWTSLLWKEI